MTKENVHVRIDSREPPEVTGAISAHPDVENYTLTKLPAADLEIGGIGFERKTIEDYNSSMQEQRLESQTRKMGERYEIAYILIEGNMAETQNVFKSSIAGNSLRGSMASLTARDSGVRSVIPCSNLDMLADYAVRLARKHVEDKGREFIPTEATEPDAPTAMKMYLQIDGVGPQMAQNLYDEFPTISRFVEESSYEKLQTIEGIGEKTAIQIIDAFV